LEKETLTNEHGQQETFLDAILKPHTCYYQPFKELFRDNMGGELHGIAHITGGGIAGNLNRILPENLDAQIDAATLRVLPVFKKIKALGNVPEADMLRTFNCGIGMTIVCGPAAVNQITTHLKGFGLASYAIGTITPGKGEVHYKNSVTW
jgi:phosphoribosylformylglycinamidine cyclo-ligase